jgi:hypothetical protein
MASLEGLIHPRAVLESITSFALLLDHPGPRIPFEQLMNRGKSPNVDAKYTEYIACQKDTVSPTFPAMLRSSPYM